MSRTPRTFTDSPAVRKKVPLLMGVTGPSGGGKTFSALRLATGMARVYGGEIIGIDTEHNRMLHYADRFKFRHVPFSPPFSPLDYIDVIAHGVKHKNAVLLIDSASHEHIGEGGVLDQHDKVVAAKGHAHNMIAWAEPKAQRRALINYILQTVDAAIFCFRAKERIDMNVKPPASLGYMAEAGDEFIFELAANALLLEGAMGVPHWNPQERGAQKMVKMPEQFRKLLLDHKGPLDERIGEEMAKWAIGGASPVGPDKPKKLVDADAAIARLRKADSLADLVAKWKELSAEEQLVPEIVKAKDDLKKHFMPPPDDDKWGGQ